MPTPDARYFALQWNIGFNCFPPSMALALSVVSMELMSPHKMADVKLRTYQRGGPGSRECNVCQCFYTVSIVAWPGSE